MWLSVQERVSLFTLLPQKGSFNTLRAMRVLQESLGLTPEERERFGWSQHGERVSWERSENVEIDVPSDIRDLIAKQLKSLDGSQQLRADSYTLYEKFVKPNEET